MRISQVNHALLSFCLMARILLYTPLDALCCIPIGMLLSWLVTFLQWWVFLFCVFFVLRINYVEASAGCLFCPPTHQNPKSCNLLSDKMFTMVICVSFVLSRVISWRDIKRASRASATSGFVAWLLFWWLCSNNTPWCYFLWFCLVVLSCTLCFTTFYFQ